jgi:hypothetical protein
MTPILDLVRQKVCEILDIYPVPDVEDVAFKQRVFEIFKPGFKDDGENGDGHDLRES